MIKSNKKCLIEEYLIESHKESYKECFAINHKEYFEESYKGCFAKSYEECLIKSYKESYKGCKYRVFWRLVQS